jgi:hypothetical protein
MADAGVLHDWGRQRPPGIYGRYETRAKALRGAGLSVATTSGTAVRIEQHDSGLLQQDLGRRLGVQLLQPSCDGGADELL